MSDKETVRPITIGQVFEVSEFYNFTEIRMSYRYGDISKLSLEINFKNSDEMERFLEYNRALAMKK